MSSSGDRLATDISVYDIVCWVRNHGEVQAESRLRIRTLPFTVREGIDFSRIDPQTPASRNLVNAMLREAAAIVGRPYST